MSGSINQSNLKFSNPIFFIEASKPSPGFRIHFQAVPVTIKESDIGYRYTVLIKPSNRILWSKSIAKIRPRNIEIVINKKNARSERINYLISRFDLDNLKDIKAKFLSGGQKKKLVIALSLLSEPKVLLLDECFAALDVLTIKMLQETIVNLQQENNITICICDHQARDLLACDDIAMILSNGKIVAQDTPSNLVKDINAKNAYLDRKSVV